MARKKVLVTRLIPGQGSQKLREKYDVKLNTEDRVLSRDELLEKIRDCDGVLSLLSDLIDGGIMDASGNLQVISNYAVGFDNIDIQAATKRGIYVCNTPRVSDDSVADFTWSLMFAVARRVVEADKLVRAGRWKGWSPQLLNGRDIFRKTLGIVGLGRIGSAVAKRAQGFNMRVMYYDIYRNSDAERQLNIMYAGMDEVLSRADIVTVHVPLMPSTRNLIDKQQLRKMKSTAYLINTSRGPVVNQMDLYWALKEGWIAGAGIDVWEKEPVGPEEPLLTLDNVVAAPHIASATIETRLAMADLAIENLTAVLEGRVPPCLVNKELVQIDRK